MIETEILLSYLSYDLRFRLNERIFAASLLINGWTSSSLWAFADGTRNVNEETITRRNIIKTALNLVFFLKCSQSTSPSYKEIAEPNLLYFEVVLKSCPKILAHVHLKFFYILSFY